MPHVNLRWRSGSYLEIDEVRVSALTKLMPEICANALSVPNGRQYKPREILIKVDQQSEMDVNIPFLMFEVIATGTPEQIARKAEAVKMIIEGVKAHFRVQNLALRMCSVWLLLPDTAFIDR